MDDGVISIIIMYGCVFFCLFVCVYVMDELSQLFFSLFKNFFHHELIVYHHYSLSFSDFAFFFSSDIFFPKTVIIIFSLFFRIQRKLLRFLSFVRIVAAASISFAVYALPAFCDVPHLELWRPLTWPRFRPFRLPCWS